MAEVQILQGANICPPILGHIRTAIPGSLRHTTTMDGGSADIAGAHICPSIHGHKKSNDFSLLYIT
jgi:hypothetical protein